jgi:DNA-binding NtrC family response regulator
VIGKGERPEFIILDVLMPEMNGLETLQQLMQVDRSLNVIMLSCSNEVTTVVEAIRLGALDYLTKPFEKPELEAAFLKCRQKQQLRSENQALREYCEALTEDISFLAASPQMLKIRQQILQIAPVDVPVFISGESGVGKEVVARMIHLRSTRRQQAFVKVNCAALPGELLESELFGYDQGAFTGAVRSKPGKFELANKGTIFLDEIAEMSPHLQAKLLHVLQDGTFSRLGGRGEKQTNARILAATNIDIQKALVEKTFREDLYYRLSTFVLHIPPLRERREEIPYVLTQMSQQLALTHGLEPVHFSPQMIAACVAYHWPGNLRELGNFVKRYLVIRDEPAALADLESKIPGYFVPVPERNGLVTATTSPDLKSMVRGLKDQAEMQAIRDTLAETKWNRRIAATRLNISYKALLYKIRQYNLSAPAQSA